MERYVEQVVTVLGVNVDSVCHNIWDANKNGVKDITADAVGVKIKWNFGATFVPWSNVRYTKENY